MCLYKNIIQYYTYIMLFIVASCNPSKRSLVLSIPATPYGDCVKHTLFFKDFSFQKRGLRIQSARDKPQPSCLMDLVPELMSSASSCGFSQPLIDSHYAPFIFLKKILPHILPYVCSIFAIFYSPFDRSVSSFHGSKSGWWRATLHRRAAPNSAPDSRGPATAATIRSPRPWRRFR